MRMGNVRLVLQNYSTRVSERITITMVEKETIIRDHLTLRLPYDNDSTTLRLILAIIRRFYAVYERPVRVLSFLWP